MEIQSQSSSADRTHRWVETNLDDEVSGALELVLALCISQSLTRSGRCLSGRQVWQAGFGWFSSGQLQLFFSNCFLCYEKVKKSLFDVNAQSMGK